MKRFLVGSALCATLLVATADAQQITVYHQPTPFPLQRCSGTSSCPGGAMPQDISVVHSWSGWFNSSYNLTLVQDNKLQIGGWGDYYVSVWRIDTEGLPASVTQAALFLYSVPSGASGPSQMAMFPIASEWNPATIGWNNFPATLGGALWPVSTVVNAFRGYNITSWYNGWRSTPSSSKGLMFESWNNDGSQRFDWFVSHRSAPPNDGQRPVLGLVFNKSAGMPDFKLPLPGNARWLLTNEIGGYECMGATPWPDTAHQGNNYFAIDISPANAKDAGGSYYGDIPVIAAASGKVVEATYSSVNGYYVVIDHDGDGNVGTGYSTRYLHLQAGLAVSPGQSVAQGDRLGYMGGTGGYEVHLHFGVRYQNQGYSSIPELSYVTMEGLLLKSYQTECDVNSYGVPTSRIRYYHSSNRVY